MKSYLLAAAAALFAVGAASGANAQLARSPILGRGSPGAMRGEVEQRYNAALAMTRSPEVVRANDVRFTWASEAKVACGIAIGFLKTGTVDEDSINKCDYYSMRMQQPPGEIMAPPVLAAAVAAPPPCATKLPILFYFEWNVATPPADAAGVAQSAAQQMQACGWKTLNVAGHADTSGSTAYNQKLSEERAKNVADLLHNAGVPAEAMTVQAFGETRPAVPTPDGVREPLNRRVEVNTAAAQ
jgi:outer membrane protein OmpA-like peptidoglycan-associated protein